MVIASNITDERMYMKTTSQTTSIRSNVSGFTILEILIAVFVMGIGFLGLSQMEYLALNLKGKSEEGTLATNIIQFAADTDMTLLKEVNQLNSNVILNAANGRTIDLTYCNGGTDSICNTCPCDPFEFLTPNPDDGVDESTCAVVDAEELDPTLLVYGDTTQCTSDISLLQNNNLNPMVVIKRAVTTVDTLSDPDLIDVSLTYAVKNVEQFFDSGLSTSLRDTLVTQNYGISGHVNNFADLASISTWSAVRAVHVP